MALHGKGIETRSECPACLAEKLAKLEADEAASEKRWKQSQIDRMMGDLQLPERFADVTLDNYEPVNPDAARCLKLCNDYATHWPERLKRGGGLVMCGKPGTGKNHLALAIAKQVINTHYERMKPTILISNLALNELAGFIGERVIDRMNDGGGCTLTFTWNSYRSRMSPSEETYPILQTLENK